MSLAFNMVWKIKTKPINWPPLENWTPIPQWPTHLPVTNATPNADSRCKAAQFVSGSQEGDLVGEAEGLGIEVGLGGGGYKDKQIGLASWIWFLCCIVCEIVVVFVWHKDTLPLKYFQ